MSRHELIVNLYMYESVICETGLLGTKIIPAKCSRNTGALIQAL